MGVFQKFMCESRSVLHSLQSEEGETPILCSFSCEQSKLSSRERKIALMASLAAYKATRTFPKYLDLLAQLCCDMVLCEKP